MKGFRRGFLILLFAFPLQLQAQESPLLRLAQTIPLPRVEGRIDHMAIDAKGRRLFIAALGNNTLEVVEVGDHPRVKSIAGLREPQGVGFVPEFNRVFAANAKGGTCEIFDSETLKLIKSVKFSDDADNVRYDPATRRVYVGYGSGGLGIIDAAQGQKIGAIKLDAHPESFQLEKSGPRIFVNIPEAQEIAVVDREKRAVIAAWPTSGARANFPMALDESHHRLFVGFRKPAKIVVFDTESGRSVATLDSPGDADDIFYDAAHKRIYISGGEGFVGIVQQQEADHYKTIANIPTASGARTSLFAPELGHFYLAVPHRGVQKSELRVYEAE